MHYGLDEAYKRFKKAVTAHNMICDEQAIMIGYSGGKDSALLLYLLKKFLPISKYKYRLAAGHISLGFKGDDIEPLQSYCDSLDIPFFYEKTQISQIVFSARQEDNPCSLCAKMRRGALNNLAKHNGFNKLALAHHQDDVLETLLLKTFFEGNIGSFNPVTYLDRTELTVIRPFIYLSESMISNVVKKENIPVVASNCPADKIGKRQEMKAIIEQIAQMSPNAKDRATFALDRLFGANWDGIAARANKEEK